MINFLNTFVHKAFKVKWSISNVLRLRFTQETKQDSLKRGHLKNILINNDDESVASQRIKLQPQRLKLS